MTSSITYSEFATKASELNDEGRALEGLVYGDQKKKDVVAFFKKYYPDSKASEITRIVKDIMIGCKELKAEYKAEIKLNKKKKSA